MSCAHERIWQRNVQWDEMELQELPGRREYPDAEAVVVLDEGSMELHNDNTIQFSVFEKHRVVKILDKSGFNFANIVIPYSPTTEVGFIQARTISPDGKVTELSEDDIYDITAFPNFIFFSDQRAKRFTMPALEEGAILEYRYRMTIWNLTYWHAWNFQESIPVMHSSFSLSAPSEHNLNYRAYGIEAEPQIIDAPAGFNSTYKWEVRDVEPITYEVGMPPLNNIIKQLALAPMGVSEWSDVTEWYHQLVKPQKQINNNIRELTDNLVGDAVNDEEKMRRIYEWVRDNVRYVAVEIGIGGYQPHAVSQVFSNRYGDCKDMVTLLCAMAEEAGIEIYQALTSTKPNGVPDTTLPSQFQFNHVIAYAPGIGENGVWMDPTKKGIEFGQLPWYDQGIQVLQVGEDGEAQFISTPVSEPGQNRIVLEWAVDLEETGAATVKGVRSLWGAPATELREDLIMASKSDRQRWMENEVADLVSGANLDSFRISGLEPVQDSLRVEYVFHAETFAVPQSDQMNVHPVTVAAYQYPDIFVSANRVHPIQFGYGMQKRVNITFNLPSNWESETSVRQDSVGSDYGYATWNWRSGENSMQANAFYSIQGEQIPASRYQEYRNFLSNVRRHDMQEIRFLRSDAPVAENR